MRSYSSVDCRYQPFVLGCLHVFFFLTPGFEFICIGIPRLEKTFRYVTVQVVEHF